MTAPSSLPTRTTSRRLPAVATAWAVVTAPLAALHLATGSPAPWRGDPTSVLQGLSPTGGSVLVLLTAAALLASLAAVSRGSGAGRRRAGLVLVAVGAVLALVLADTRSLSFLGYLPMIVLGALGVGPLDHVDPDVVGPAMFSLGSTLAGLSALVLGARALGADRRWSPARARRTGRWAVAVAATIPLLYALPRFAWHLGVPLGVSEEFLATLGDASVAGLGLGLFAVVGSLLTLGLVMPWGETFWSWVPVVGGRPVPVSLAVVPALFVSTAVMTAGVGFVRMAVGGDLADVPGATTDWATWAPTLLWPAWAAALAVAALAYRARRADPA